MIYIKINAPLESKVNTDLLFRLVAATGIHPSYIKVYSDSSGIEPPAFTQKQERPQSTFYCLFLPLGLYCQFGARNIHHAYNKAAKYWGSKPAEDTLEWPEHKVVRECRIVVYADDKPLITFKEISQPLMTRLVKAWREENA